MKALKTKYTGDICMHCTEFEFRGGDFSNSSHGRQGFRAPLETRLDYVSFDSSKSRS